MGNKVPISFKSYRIERIEYKEFSDEEIKSKATLKGGFSVTKDRKQGFVRQEVIVYNTESRRKLQVDLIASFKIIDTSLSEDEINSLLARNGSAMLYPYVRTIVSIISSLDSPKVVNLPSLNFSDAYENSLHDDK